MGERIKVWKGTLTVGANDTWSVPTGSTDYNTTGSEFYTGVVDGEILKILVAFTSSDNNATLRITTRDSPSETVFEKTNWTTTTNTACYPVVEAKLYDGSSAASTSKSNVYKRLVAKGSLNVTCTSSTVGDTATIMVFWR